MTARMDATRKALGSLAYPGSVAGSTDKRDRALAEVEEWETRLEKAEANERHMRNLHDWRAKGETEQRARAEAAEAELASMLDDRNELMNALAAAEAERDMRLAEQIAENSRLRGQLSEIAHTNAPVIRDLGARAEAAEAVRTQLLDRAERLEAAVREEAEQTCIEIELRKAAEAARDMLLAELEGQIGRRKDLEAERDELKVWLAELLSRNGIVYNVDREFARRALAAPGNTA